MNYELQPGEETDIEVRDLPQLITFALSARRREYHAMPLVKVTEEYVGFSLEINSVRWIRSETDSKGGTVDHYEVDVTWSPGGDQSGSRMSVTYPYSREEATAHVYMIA